MCTSRSGSISAFSALILVVLLAACGDGDRVPKPDSGAPPDVDAGDGGLLDAFVDAFVDAGDGGLLDGFVDAGDASLVDGALLDGALLDGALLDGGEDAGPPGECQTEANDCDPNATCTNTVGGHSCACPGGFVDTLGNGTACADRDECAAHTDLCDDDPIATCQNTFGSYTCTCPSGFYDVLGDGSHCTTYDRVVALGTGHTCAILEGGIVKCWGQGYYGELGLDERIMHGHREGQTGEGLMAANLGGRAIELAAGCSHTCALLEGGDVKCWGRNHEGQLGVGDTGSRGDGRLECVFGSSPACTCNNPPANTVCSQPNPTSEMGDFLDPVPLGTQAIGVAAGCEYSCALLAGGGVTCWGGNEYGQIGIGNREAMGDEPGEVETLGPIPIGGPIKRLRGGFRYICAQFYDDTLKCWGRNNNGQLGQNSFEHLGDNPNEITAIPPINFGTGRTVKTFAAGYINNCALLDNDTIKCWGGSIGGSGYGDILNRGDGRVQGNEADINGNEMGDTLATIDLVGTPVALAVEYHSCVLFSDQTISCFGINDQGELGLGDMNNRGDDPNEMGTHLPRISLGGSNRALAVYTGTDEDTSLVHTCALLDTGGLKCWGDNTRGQLGIADDRDRGGRPGEMGNALPVAMQLW